MARRTTKATDATGAAPAPDVTADDVTDILADAAPANAAHAEPAPPVEPILLVDPPAAMPVPPPASPPRAPVPEPAVIVQKANAGPLLVAGILTAALGFGAAWVARDWMAAGTQAPDLSAPLSDLDARVAALETAPPPMSPDAALAALDASIAAVAARVDAVPAPSPDLSGDLAALGQVVAAIDTRLTTLERAPAPDGTLTAPAIAAWTADIAALQATLADQSARLDALSTTPPAIDMATVEARLAEMTAAAQAELAAAQAQTAAAEAAASAAMAGAGQRAAMDRVLAALDAGTPFEVPLADLTTAGANIPDALALVAADGLPTLAALQAAFPDAARAALSAARAEGLDGDSGGFTAFLRNTLDIRSVTPRDGTDPDAILSRAEAALIEGRLTDALAEVASLPEVVRAAMSAWTGPAQSRAAALSAATTLSETLAAQVP